MTISFKKGDMFSEAVDALVNTVNCVGVMGKGVALEFKKRWPDNYKEYKKLCSSKDLRPGKVFVFDTKQLFPTDGPRFLVNFPTKDHWRAKSKLDYVESGLDALVEAIKDYGIKSIAIPPLGCGNGGLEWSDVKPLIIEKLDNLSNVDVRVFYPKEAFDEPEYSHPKFAMTFERAVLLKCLGDLEPYFDGSFDRISMQKIVYFLQAIGVSFNLKFSRNLHGPYSEALKRAFIALEQHKMISGFQTSDRQAHVTPSGYAVADEYLSSNDVAERTIERLGKLVQGYESPYGLELLSSVHWLAHHENCYPLERVITEMNSWNENKRNIFSGDTIRVAYERLLEDGLLNCA